MPDASFTRPLSPDPVAIQAFIDTYFVSCTAGYIEISWSDPAKEKPFFARHFSLGDRTIGEFIVRLNRQAGVNIYYAGATVSLSAPRRSKDEHFVQAPAAWSDADTLAAIEAAQKVVSIIRPTDKIVTGSVPGPREQTLIRYTAPLTDPLAQREILQKLCALCAGDRAVTNPTSLLRVPGTISWPKRDKVEKEGRIVELTAWHPAPGAKPADPDILRRTLANVPVPEPEPRTSLARSVNRVLTERDRVSPDDAIKNIEAGNNWHDNLIRLLAHLMYLGAPDSVFMAMAPNFTLPPYTLDDTIREMREAIDKWRAARGLYDPGHLPMVNDAIAAREARDAFLLAAPLPAEPAPVPEKRFPLIPVFDAFAKLAERPDFVIDGFLIAGQIMLLSGLPSSGKSPIVHDMCACMSLGAPWAGRNTRPCRIVYVAGESIEQTVRNLRNFAKAAFLRAWPELPDNEETDALITSICADRLLVMQDTFILQNDTDNFIAELSDNPPDIVVFDTIRAVSSGSLNKDEDLVAVQHAIYRMHRAWPKCAIAAINHAPKANPADSTGSNRLPALADVIVSCVPREASQDVNDPEKFINKPKWSTADSHGWRYSCIGLSMQRNKVWQNAEPIPAILAVKDNVCKIFYNDDASEMALTGYLAADSAARSSLPPIVDGAAEEVLPSAPVDDSTGFASY